MVSAIEILCVSNQSASCILPEYAVIGDIMYDCWLVRVYCTVGYLPVIDLS